MFHDKRLLVTLTMLGLSAWLSAPVRAQDATPALKPPVAVAPAVAEADVPLEAVVTAAEAVVTEAAAAVETAAADTVAAAEEVVTEAAATVETAATDTVAAAEEVVTEAAAAAEEAITEAAAVETAATDTAEEAAPVEEGESIEHQMLFLVLQIGLILFAAKLVGNAAVAVGLPSVIGELAAGIIIGPYALGSIGIGTLFPNGIFPLPTDPTSTIPVTPALYGFCTVASIILLFLSGIETNFKMFLRYAFSGSLVGLGGVIFSFLFGDLCAMYLLPKFIAGYENLTVFHPACLFMGIMSTATSVGITARILSERKVMDSPEGTTTMAAAVIDDVLGIIVLAIGLGVIASESSGGGASGVQWSKIGGIALKAFGIWLGGTIIGLLAARRISFLLKLFQSPVAIAIMAFGLSMVVSAFFQSMGLSLIIGAYVMGLALSRTDIRHIIEENLQPLYTFLVPVFFCVMGMMVNLTAISSKPVLLFGAIYTVLAILAKVLGCALPSLFCGFNFRGSMRIGVGMIPRGEVALIVAGIGLSSGYLTSDIFSIGILMTLVTTVISPPMLVGLFKSPKPGVRHVPSPEATSRPLTYSLPNAETAQLLLDKLIAAFRSEGFFTAMLNLNPNEEIWQITRDSDDIVVSRQGKDLLFNCTPHEEAFIATALLDVTAELSSLASSLSMPIATTSVARKVLDPDSALPRNADSELSRYIRNFLYVPRLRAASKEEAIRKITDLFAQKGLLDDGAKAAEDILKREALMSTGLEHGIAIPHARTDLVNGLIGALAVFPDGIPNYSTVDGSAVKILVITLSSKSVHTPHLRLIAHISQVLNEEGRKKLLEAKTEAEMLNVLTSAKASA